MTVQRIDGAGFLIDTSELEISIKCVAVMTTYHMHMHVCICGAVLRTLLGVSKVAGSNFEWNLLSQ